MIGIYIGMGVAVLLIVFGILRTIDWYGIFNRKYGNDPTKGKVYIDFGENEDFVDGYYIFSDDQYVYYEYEYRHRSFTVAVPIEWEFVFVRGRRKVEVDFGNEFAKALSNDKPRSHMGAELLNRSMKKRMAVAMVDSLESHKGINIILIGVVVLGFVLLMVFHPWSHKAATPAINNNPVVTQNATQPKTIEQLMQGEK